jgi:hypothetical protein
MSVPVRLALFAVVVGIVFVSGWALGSAVGPFDANPAQTRMEHSP